MNTYHLGQNVYVVICLIEFLKWKTFLSRDEWPSKERNTDYKNKRDNSKYELISGIGEVTWWRSTNAKLVFDRSKFVTGQWAWQTHRFTKWVRVWKGPKGELIWFCQLSPAEVMKSEGQTKWYQKYKVTGEVMPAFCLVFPSVLRGTPKCVCRDQRSRLNISSCWSSHGLLLDQDPNNWLDWLISKTQDPSVSSSQLWGYRYVPPCPPFYGHCCDLNSDPQVWAASTSLTEHLPSLDKTAFQEQEREIIGKMWWDF